MTNFNKPSKSFSDTEMKLEKFLKETIKDYIHANGSFEINPDDQSHRFLEKIVNKIGFSVYGMNITNSEFSIKFDIETFFFTVRNRNQYLPRYCEISLDNMGEYRINFDEETLKDNWHLTIRDANFNPNKSTAEEIDHISDEFHESIILTKLSN